MSSDNRVRNRISPIQMKSGRAVSDQDEAEDQISVIIASPAGRMVNISIPTQATPSRASPTQTPDPRSRKRTNRKMTIGASSCMRVYSPWLWSTRSSPMLSCLVRTSVTRLSRKQRASSTAPAAIGICGIQRGVMSWPWLMSCSLCDQ